MTVPMPPAAPIPLPATRQRPRLVAGIVAVAFFMQMLDGTIIATSLPTMAADFGTDVVSLNVGFTAYLLAMAICIPPAGWLSDRFGSRNVFLAAICLFTASSLACAMAEGLWSFAAARIVQGASGALMTPVGRQIVLRNTPKSELVHAIALITWPALLAPVVGPMLGGWITTHAGWHWNFLLNLPFGIVGAGLTLLFLDGRYRETPRPFDGFGFAWTAGSLTALLIGLELLSLGSGAVGPALVAAGLLLGALSVRHLRRAVHPLLDLSVLRVQSFALSTLGPGTVGRMAINATPFLLPLLLQVGIGLDAIETGSLMLVYFLGNLAMKVVTTPVLRRVGFRTLLVCNGILASAAVAGFASVDGATPKPFLLALLFAAGLTRSMHFTALNTIAFADIGPAQRSPATVLSAMTTQVSQLLAIAISAILVRLLSTAGGAAPGATAGLADFQVAFAVMGIAGGIASLRFLALASDAGAEVASAGRVAR